MKKRILTTLMILLSCSIFAVPTIGILDFENEAFSVEIAMATSEIFRSKVILSNEFQVIERNDLSIIMEEQSLQLSGLTKNESFQTGLIGDVDYLALGKMIRVDDYLSLIIKIIDVESGEIKGSADRIIKNMDTLDSEITAMTLSLISAVLERYDFTFDTGTFGLSLEFGINGGFGQSSYPYDISDNKNPVGLGFSLGFTDGRENLWSTFFTSWTFTNENIKLPASEFENKTKILALVGGGFIFGNKVEGLGIELGIGGGYDFAYGMTATVYSSIYYRNFYLRYSPILNFWLGDNPSYTGLMHGIEIGYSLFFGHYGKDETAFY